MYVYRSPADLYNVRLETKTCSLQEVQDITKKNSKQPGTIPIRDDRLIT